MKLKKKTKDKRKANFEQLRNKSDMVQNKKKDTVIKNLINDQMLTKSLEPGSLHRNIDALKKNAPKSADPTLRDKGNWGFNVPIRLSHTQNIDFSGTGGSGNANSRQKRKQILSSLLDSGKEKFLFFFEEKQNYSIRTRFSIQRNSQDKQKEGGKNSAQNKGKKKIKFPLNTSDSNFYRAAKIYGSEEQNNNSYNIKKGGESPYNRTFDNSRNSKMKNPIVIFYYLTNRICSISKNLLS